MTVHPSNETAHPWRRMVAVGDSFTEGIGDPDPLRPGGHRGWADRVAEVLAASVDDFAYANLAVRGKLIGQIARSDRTRPGAAPRPRHLLRGWQRRHPARRRPRRRRAAVRGRRHPALLRRGDRRGVHGDRHELHAGVPRHPRQGRDLQREHPRDRGALRLHRGRPVGAERGAGHAVLRRRPPALQRARPPRGGPDGAARAQRPERSAGDAARTPPPPHVARGPHGRHRVGADAPGAVGAAARAAPVLRAMPSPRSGRMRCRCSGA